MNKIQELKEKVGGQAKNIIESGLSLEKKHNKYRCPNKIQHKNHDKNPSMSWDDKALQFYCFTCGHKIDIYSYLREHLGKGHDEIMREYGLKEGDIKVTKTFKLDELTKECRDYLHLRKINDDTIRYFEVGSYKGNVAFPYKEGQRTIGVKYRPPKKKTDGPKYMSVKDSKLTLFNKQNIDIEANELMITEGEIDAMIIHQCGYTNVVSLGRGSASAERTIEEEKDFLDNFDSFIVISDNDEAGKEMDKAFIDKFGVKAKLVDKSLLENNDINLEYYYNGKSKIDKIIESAVVKIEGLRDLDRQPYKGVEAIQGNYIPTGIKTIDFAMNDLAPQCTTLVTGRAGEGKTTFVNQVMANAIDEGNSVLLVSGEGVQEILINRFYRALIGNDENYIQYKKINKRTFREPTQEAIKAIRKWHENKMTMFNKGDSNLKTTDELFDFISYEIKLSQHNLVIIDNLMSVLSVNDSSEKLEAQADFMQRCCDIAKSYNTHIILVLHPNKTLQKGQDFEFEQISGTQDLPNKADNIIFIRREYDESVRASGVHGEIKLKKNRIFGEFPSAEVFFDDETATLQEIAEDGSRLAYSFKWKNYLNGGFAGEEIDINRVELPWDKEE